MDARKTKVLAYLFSVPIVAIGFGAIWLGLTGDYPALLGICLGCFFLVLAAWNVITLPRTSGYPEGTWLLGLSVGAVFIAVLGLYFDVLEVVLPLGSFGTAGLLEARKQSRQQ